MKNSQKSLFFSFTVIISTMLLTVTTYAIQGTSKQPDASTQAANSSKMLTLGQTAGLTPTQRIGEVFFVPEKEQKLISGSEGTARAEEVKLGIDSSRKYGRSNRVMVDPSTLSKNISINWPEYTYNPGEKRATKQLTQGESVNLTLPVAWLWRCTNSFARTNPSIGKDDSYKGTSNIAWNAVKMDGVASLFNVSGKVTKIDEKNTDYILRVDFEVPEESITNLAKKQKQYNTNDRAVYADSRLSAISDEYFTKSVALESKYYAVSGGFAVTKEEQSSGESNGGRLIGNQETIGKGSDIKVASIGDNNKINDNASSENIKSKEDGALPKDADNKSNSGDATDTKEIEVLMSVVTALVLALGILINKIMKLN